MSTAIEKKFSSQIDPTLTFKAGQYFVTMQDQNGTVYHKIVSPAAVREAFTNEVVDSGWLPPETVRFGVCRFGEWFVAFIPPARYELPLEAHEGEEGAVQGVVKITAPLPGLIFFGCNYKYFVWAVKSQTFDPKAEVFHPPLPNVGMDSPTAPPGLICYGLHKPLKCRAATFMQAWKLFIETPFNNHTADGKSRKYPEDVRLMLRELAARAMYPTTSDLEELIYPVEDLNPLVPNRTLTVEKLIKTWLLDESKPSGDDLENAMLKLFEAKRQ